MKHPYVPEDLAGRAPPAQAPTQVNPPRPRTPSSSVVSRGDIVLRSGPLYLVPRTPHRQPAGDSTLSLGDGTMQRSTLTPSEMRRAMRSEMIQSALSEGASDGADSNTVAGSAVRALTSLLGELKPLVGELAMRALYVRSLHLARSSFERPDTADLRSSDELLAPLHSDLVSRAPAEARSAAEALLLALANLLVSLIGEPLTNRLLHKAWGNPPLAKPSHLTSL